MAKVKARKRTNWRHFCFSGFFKWIPIGAAHSSQTCAQWLLRPARLPIPPTQHVAMINCRVRGFNMTTFPVAKQIKKGTPPPSSGKDGTADLRIMLERWGKGYFLRLTL